MSCHPSQDLGCLITQKGSERWELAHLLWGLPVEHNATRVSSSLLGNCIVNALHVLQMLALLRSLMIEG
jgi:hypothetical protein